MKKDDVQKKEKLLFVVEAMGGGVFTYIVDLTNQLIKNYDLYIAYAVRNQTPKNYKEYFHPQVHLIEVKHFVRKINLIQDFKSFFEIRRIAREIKPDIIHLHSSKAGILGRLAFNGNRIPLFYTPHGYSFLMQDSGFLKKRMYKILEMIAAKSSCTTISCSEGEHKETLKLTKQADYVNNGINIEELEEVMKLNIGMEKKSFTVYTLGRICYQKNPALFNKIAQSMPDVKFVWIGDGELRGELTAPNIIITGWVDRKTALRNSIEGDVFLLTSLWEGLPISLLESMYMKKVCVVSDVIGNHDVIHDRENGFVCNSESDFVKAISECKDGKVEGIKKKAYTDICEKYNTKVMAEAYIKIYKKSDKNRK